MSRSEKLMTKLFRQPSPKDFTWNELISVMEMHGFVLHENSGSSRKFIHPETQVPFLIHKPHPSPILKQYQVTAAKNAIDRVRKG